MSASQVRALKIALSSGAVYAGWNPGGGTRRVSHSTLASLERLGLLRKATHAYELTREGAAAVTAM